MTTGILHLHLLLALIFLVGLFKGSGVWLRIAGGTGALLVLTGVHNFMTRMTGPPAGWHAGVGIKILLGLHAVTMVFLLMRGGDAARTARWRKGALITSVLTLLIGLYFSNLARR